GEILRRVAPLWLRCSPSDLGLSSQVRSPHFQRPTLYLYDAVQGGVGLSEALHASWRDLVRSALDVVAHCPCDSGCPGCVGPREEVGPLGKSTALGVLHHLAEGPEPVAADPERVDERDPRSAELESAEA
ncbi:MAG: hypothetical protein RL112_1864, partial [Planctomycetota bacterium]